MPHESFTEVVYDDGRGRMAARRYPQMLSCVVSGYADESMVHWYIREFHAFLDALTRRSDIFHDWAAVTGFSPDARRIFLKWGRDRNDFNRRMCRSVNILVESTLLYLALEAAGTFTRGYMKAYRSRQTFELERDAHLRRPSDEPIPRIEHP
jgi:hypothetical protein